VPAIKGQNCIKMGHKSMGTHKSKSPKVFIW